MKAAFHDKKSSAAQLVQSYRHCLKEAHSQDQRVGQDQSPHPPKPIPPQGAGQSKKEKKKG